MPVSKIGTNALASGLDVSSTNISYTGTLTGGTGVVNLGSGQVYKDASGNVGIGVTPSAWSGAWKAIQVGSVAAFTASGTTATYGCNWYDDGTAAKYVTNGFAARYTTNNAGQHQWFTAASGTAGNAISFTQAMTLDSSGNLLVGQTSDSNTAAGTRLEPAGRWVVVRGTSTGSQTIAAFYRADGGGSAVGSITTTNTATSYVTSSDYRLKHDIAPITGALARVTALKPVTYKWNVDDSDGEGFIAHELQEVCPSAVIGEKDAVDAEGNIVPQGIDTSFLVATLTAAIQELKAELDSVKAELAVLKGV